MHDSLRINCIRVNNNAKSNILKEEKGEGFFIIIIGLHNKECWNAKFPSRDC